jgi:predicted transcriptional regulator
MFKEAVARLDRINSSIADTRQYFLGMHSFHAAGDTVSELEYLAEKIEDISNSILREALDHDFLTWRAS